MIGPESDSRALLGAITDAFARGDSPAGERLFMDALDRGVAWDEITCHRGAGLGPPVGGSPGRVAQARAGWRPSGVSLRTPGQVPLQRSWQPG